MEFVRVLKNAWPISYTEEYKAKKEENTLIEIPVHQISPNPHQPRRNFEEAFIKDLSESIKKYGVIQPITVRRLSSGSYELVTGERRLRASIMAGLLKIPSIVVSLGDRDSAVVALIENIQRENLTFLEEAEAYRNLLCTHGFTQEELAKRLGKTQSSVANKVRLLKLSNVVRGIITENNLTERHARALLKLENEHRQIIALEKISEKNLNVAQTEELIEEMLTEKIKKKTDIKSFVPSLQVKDVRIFANTVKHAIDVMRKNGIEAESIDTEYEEYYEYIIHIPKTGM